MSYLKRKIDYFLEKWKNDPDRLPLIIKGTRQVGKTESIRSFAEKTILRCIKRLTIDGVALSIVNFYFGKCHT